jgi:DNA-binding transcriptional ArsR family regulator
MTSNDHLETSDDIFTQAEEFVISDLDTLKVVADPLRLQIIELIFDHPHTVKQIASKLKLAASKLYYHINLLEKHNLISIASTRIVSGIVEKTYMSSARNIRVMKGLLTPQRTQDEKDQGVALFVDAILNDAKQDIMQNAASGLIDLSGEENPLSLRLSRTTTRLSEEKALEFQKRLRELVSEFQVEKEDPTNADAQGYALVLAFYPTTRGDRPGEANGEQIDEN